MIFFVHRYEFTCRLLYAINHSIIIILLFLTSLRFDLMLHQYSFDFIPPTVGVFFVVLAFFFYGGEMKYIIHIL